MKRTIGILSFSFYLAFFVVCFIGGLSVFIFLVSPNHYETQARFFPNLLLVCAGALLSLACTKIYNLTSLKVFRIMSCLMLVITFIGFVLNVIFVYILNPNFIQNMALQDGMPHEIYFLVMFIVSCILPLLALVFHFLFVLFDINISRNDHVKNNFHNISDIVFSILFSITIIIFGLIPKNNILLVLPILVSLPTLLLLDYLLKIQKPKFLLMVYIMSFILVLVLEALLNLLIARLIVFSSLDLILVIAFSVSFIYLTIPFAVVNFKRTLKEDN